MSQQTIRMVRGGASRRVVSPVLSGLPLVDLSRRRRMLGLPDSRLAEDESLLRGFLYRAAWQARTLFDNGEALRQARRPALDVWPSAIENLVGSLESRATKMQSYAEEHYWASGAPELQWIFHGKHWGSVALKSVAQGFDSWEDLLRWVSDASNRVQLLGAHRASFGDNVDHFRDGLRVALKKACMGDGSALQAFV